MKRIMTYLLAMLLLAGCNDTQSVGDQGAKTIDGIIERVKNATSEDELVEIFDSEYGTAMTELEANLNTLVIDGDSTEYYAEFAKVEPKLNELVEALDRKSAELSEDYFDFDDEDTDFVDEGIDGVDSHADTTE